MLEGLRTAAAGMAAQQQKLDAMANDLANANTTGYKHVRVGFADLLYNQAGRPSANGVDVGTGVRAAQAGGAPARRGPAPQPRASRGGRAWGRGALRQTGQPLDVAIQGEGFIKIRLSDGRQALTR